MNIYPTNDWTIAKGLVVTEAEIGLVLLFETKTGSHKYTKPPKIHSRGKLSTKRMWKLSKITFFPSWPLVNDYYHLIFQNAILWDLIILQLW